MSRSANEKVKRFQPRAPGIEDILRQIEAEYREMPGLSVTEAQARRLWGLDHATCRRALDALIERGVLRRTGRAAYVMAGMSSRPPAVSAVRRFAPASSSRLPDIVSSADAAIIRRRTSPLSSPGNRKLPSGSPVSVRTAAAG